MKKKLPYGMSNYRSLVEDHYIYVDKTQYLERLENLHEPFLFFLRPRRFGKSLFTSVLENYYDVKAVDDFERLFGNTYIGKNPTPGKNNYYILKFNFSKLNTESKKTLEESFLRTINHSFKEFANKYGLDLNYDDTGFAASVFEDFLGEIAYKIDKPLYVIIDEYDHFANELLSFQTDMFSEMISKTGFVRKWYETLKVGTETIIKKIFATGVSPITLDSLTSGFNIASDITRDPRFNAMMGFTEEEVRELISQTEGLKDREERIDDLVEELRKNYNGYLFSEDAKSRLFNSDMVLYYLKSYENFGKGPRELIDKNIASDYGKLGKMFELKNKTGNMKVLDSILKGEQIKASITSQFSMEKDFEADDFKSLLFYLGLLTIEKERLSRVILRVPNYAIKGLYFDFFMKKLNEPVDYELDVAMIKEDLEYEVEATEVREALKNIAQRGDDTKLIEIVERTLVKLSYRDYIKFDEKYVKLIMLTYCFLSKIYLVKPEYEVEGGYIDIALLKQADISPKYFAIFELKYITKKEYAEKGESIVQERLAEATEQLKKYQKSEELSQIKQLKKWAIVFVGEQCVVNQEILTTEWEVNA